MPKNEECIAFWQAREGSSTLVASGRKTETAKSGLLVSSYWGGRFRPEMDGRLRPNVGFWVTAKTSGRTAVRAQSGRSVMKSKMSALGQLQSFNNVRYALEEDKTGPP